MSKNLASTIKEDQFDKKSRETVALVLVPLLGRDYWLFQPDWLIESLI